VLDVALTVHEPRPSWPKPKTSRSQLCLRPNKTPDAYNDVSVLQRIISNAERLGDLEYAEMARVRIDYLKNGLRDELRAEFKRIMEVYEEFLSEKNDRTTRATYTWRKVANRRIEQR
jgi:hypothetical protein